MLRILWALQPLSLAFFARSGHNLPEPAVLWERAGLLGLVIIHRRVHVCVCVYVCVRTRTRPTFRFMHINPGCVAPAGLARVRDTGGEGVWGGWGAGFPSRGREQERYPVVQNHSWCLRGMSAPRSVSLVAAGLRVSTREGTL